MNRRTVVVSVVVMGIWLRPVQASAHRLDEYLQATRLSIDAGQVGLEIDLTPGVRVAHDVFEWMDTNRDGLVSPVEADAYAREVVRSIVLSVDGRPLSVTSLEIAVPQFAQMSLGLGTIRIRASAHDVPVSWGHHRLAFVNTHKPESSVYLVNVLMPLDGRIEIGGEWRDPAQHGLTFDYSIMPVRSWSMAGSLFAGLLMAGLLGVTRWPRGSHIAVRTTKV
ncbi:MAG TPA: hypothetical protein VNZ26_13675 [Vicinamibacterales bacterium]|jgi:hypothetical protein|nr:hypothetical protein [Vicinamibacterales bacterium]